jgi:hypothetical protein
MLSARLASFVLAGAVVSGPIGAAIPASAQGSFEPDGRMFVVRLTPDPKTSCYSMSTQQTASRGYGDGLKDLGGGALGIRTGIRGEPATRLRIAIACPGFAVVTLDATSLLSSGSFEAAVSLKPLGDVAMTGRLLAPEDGVSLVGSSLTVLYQAPWLCPFLHANNGVIDCGVPQWRVALGKIAENSMFRVTVPDFIRDPAVPAASPRIEPFGQGKFILWVDRTAEPYRYALEPAGLGTLTLASSYEGLLLRPRRR